MSEKLNSTELKEVLNPRNTPALGFQSYEMLGGDGARREDEKSQFIAGENRNPDLDYPRLDEQKLNSGLKSLESILSIAESLPESQRSAVWDSTAYRMAEMYWLKGILRINQLYIDGNQALLDELIPQVQELGEQLYGIPEQSLQDRIIGEISNQISQKELSEQDTVLLKELTTGFSVDLADEHIDIPALDFNSTKQLPQISSEVLQRLGNKIRTDFADILDIAKDYYDTVIMNRVEGDRFFAPSDMFRLFELAHKQRDPGNISDVQVIMDPDATALSWDITKMAVIVGGRRKPITTLEEAQSKLIHEYGIHGGRTVSGSKTDLPVLGTGIHCEADMGEQPDYLTFEEGFASLCEKALQPKKEKWTPLDMERTLATGLAYKGYDFRQTYETLWRIRVLLQAKSGVPTSQESIKKAQSNAYTSCERVFRGTPTRMPRVTEAGNARILTYNKDLAYLSGKLIAAKFIAAASEEDFDLSFRAKIDPTNHRQLRLAKEVMIA